MEQIKETILRKLNNLLNLTISDDEILKRMNIIKLAAETLFYLEGCKVNVNNQTYSFPQIPVVPQSPLDNFQPPYKITC